MCSDCNKFYTRQTRRPIIIQYNEHIKATNHPSNQISRNTYLAHDKYTTNLQILHKIHKGPDLNK